MAIPMPEREDGQDGPEAYSAKLSARQRVLFACVAAVVILCLGFEWPSPASGRTACGTGRSATVGLHHHRCGPDRAVRGLRPAHGGVGRVNVWLANRLRPPMSAMSPRNRAWTATACGSRRSKGWLLVGRLRAGRPDRGRLGRRPVARVAGVHPRRALRHRATRSSGSTSSFYTFDLPWYRFLLGFGFAAVVLSLIAGALTHYLYGGVRRHQPGRAGHAGGHRPSVGAARTVRLAQGRRVLARPVRTRGQVQRLQGTNNGWTGPALRGRQRVSAGENDPVLHRGDLRAAVLRHPVAAHLAAPGASASG